jgi:hypothetical protein
VIDPNALPACCNAGNAHCVPAALVPAAQAGQLAPCSGGYCAPDPFIASAGQFIPGSCVSIGNAEGRCLSTCLPAIAEQAMLPQSSCAAGERCAPCFSPINGAATGACKLSCDPGPAQPAVQFASCCNNEGRCVPRDAVPAMFQNNLKARDCAGTSLCVPAENLNAQFKPMVCTATGFLIGGYQGVCLSSCLRYGIRGLFIAQGSCSGDHKCVPCQVGGRPTGAPGCA